MDPGHLKESVRRRLLGLPAASRAATARGTASGHLPRARAGASALPVVRRVARAVTARVSSQKPGRSARPVSHAGGAVARPAPQQSARGAEERITRLLYEERSKKAACAKAHALLSRDELEVAPGAALAYRRVRAAGAAARTRKLVHCKRRDEKARPCRGRVIGRAQRAHSSAPLTSLSNAGATTVAAGLQRRRPRGRAACSRRSPCRPRDRAALL